MEDKTAYIFKKIINLYELKQLRILVTSECESKFKLMPSIKNGSKRSGF